MSFKVTWKTHIICFLLALLVSLAMNNTAGLIIENFCSSGLVFYPTGSLVANFYIQITILMIPVTIVHELIHGITYKLFGGQIEYGFKIIYAYTHEISGLAIERTKFLIILLAPLVMISIVSIFFPIWIGGMIYYLNLLGSVGDLYMAFHLSRCSHSAKIIDRRYGFDVV